MFRSLPLLLFLYSFIYQAHAQDSTSLEIAPAKAAFDHKYFFQNTGFGLKAGDSYYHNINLNNHFYSYGWRDDLNVEVGLNLFSLVVESPYLELGLSKQFQLADRWRLNAGISTIGIVFDEDLITMGQVSVTYGLSHSNMNIGIAPIYASSMNEYHQARGFEGIGISAAGKLRLTSRTSLIAEYHNLASEYEYNLGRARGSMMRPVEYHTAFLGISRQNKGNVFSASLMYHFNNRNFHVFGLLWPVLSLRVPVS